MPGYTPSKVVICGAGLHGSALAYYLTKMGHKDVTVVERVAVACAASGKGGGFLARDWGSGPTEQLHRVSFALHAKLARDLGIATYRRIQVLEVEPGPKRGLDGGGPCPWLDGDRVASVGMMDADGAAQVDPLELCTKLMDAAVKAGAKLVTGRVEGIATAEVDGGLRGVTGVVVDGKTVECDGAIVAMGPWSSLASDWLDCPIPITGIKSTSIVFRRDGDDGDVAPFALFCGEDDEHGTHLEVYPRTSGEVYLCGVGGSEHVSPERLVAGEFPPGEVDADPARVRAATEAFASLSKTLAKPAPDVAQACMRPCPPDALPLMGKVGHVRGAYVSAGHNCWGILWAPVSGKSMAELVATGEAKCVDLSPFAPTRFMRAATKRKGGGRGRHQKEQPVGEQW